MSNSESMDSPGDFEMKEVSSNKVRILSYNLFIRPPGIKNNASDFKSDRLNYFRDNELCNWDIIGFQELFGSFSKRRKRFLEEAAKKGFLYHVKTHAPKLTAKAKVDGGLVILSRYPILEHDFIKFTYGVQSDALAEKGVLYAKIQIQDHIFHFFNTHLQASYNDRKSLRNAGKNIEVRNYQLETLRDFITSKTRNDMNPIIVLGDFNINGKDEQDTTKESEEYLTMFNIFQNAFQVNYKVEDILKECKGGHPSTVGDYEIVDGQKIPKEVHLTHKNDLSLGKRLDYIFWILNEQYELQKFRKEDEVQELISKFRLTSDVYPFFVEGKPFTQLSDHYGVGLYLSF